ncbi:MAG: VWA domain-containing protein [Pyrinomonadaceae bacterium]
MLTTVSSVAAPAQCLSDADIGTLAAKSNSTPSKHDPKLREQLLNIKTRTIDRFEHKASEIERADILTKGVFEKPSRVITAAEAMATTRKKDGDRFCELFRSNGFFINSSIVGPDGTAAAFYLMKNLMPIEVQIKLIPLITGAVKRNEIPKSEDYAAFIDRLRLNVGLRQLFGTQATVDGDLLRVEPIAREADLDQRRAVFNMPPMNEYLKYLEFKFRMPAMIAQTDKRTTNTPQLKSRQAAQAEEIAEKEGDEVIRVRSDLVNLNVHVFGTGSAREAEGLEQKDFSVFEEGHEEEISFFAKNEEPFDLVLLMDLSGSTVSKQGLIRKAARRFIEAARPDDRIALITFTDKVRVIRPLTGDRDLLMKSIGKIDDIGRSHVWDALKFSLDNSFDSTQTGRRRAVVIMSDGVDNALIFGGRERIGSSTSFAQLLQTVRRGDCIVVPVYLDTEDKTPCSIGSGRYCSMPRVYRTARATLSLLAVESGGKMYHAEKIEDLDQVYHEVLKDLSTVYSIGYTPTQIHSRGSWRNVTVTIRNRPGLQVKTRSGYYSK